MFKKTRMYLSGLLFLPVIIQIGFAQDRALTARERMHKWTTLEAAQTLVRDVPDAEYIRLQHSQLPRNLRADMYNALAWRMSWEAHPQQRGKIWTANDLTVRVFAVWNGKQDDLVEYSWTYKKQNLRLTASLNAMRFDIDLDELDSNPHFVEFGPDLVKKANALFSELIRLNGTDPNVGEQKPDPYEIHIPWPDSLKDGTSFSSNTETSIVHIMRWHQRVDFNVRDGVLSMLTYKKIPQLMGFQDGSKWFTDDFRAMIHERARAEGKLPPPTTQQKP